MGSICPTNKSLIFSLFLLLWSVVAVSPAYAQQDECVITVASNEVSQKCTPGTSTTCPGQYICNGFYRNSGAPCQACTGTTPVNATCTFDCSSLADPNSTMAFTECKEPYTCSGRVSSVSECYYCVLPLCPPGTTPYRGECVEGLTCSIETPYDITSTTASAKTRKDSNGSSLSGYTTVQWSLTTPDGVTRIIGDTPIQSDGSSSNTFTNLTPSTNYRITAKYYSTVDPPRPAVTCNGSGITSFTTSPPTLSTQTCTLNGKSGICGNGQSQTPGGGQITCGGTLEQGGSSSCTNPNYSICYVCSPKQVIPGCEASGNVSESITANNASPAITVNPGQAVNINWRPLNVPSSGQVTNCSLSGALSEAVQPTCSEPTCSKPLNTQRSGTYNVFISCQYIDNNSSCNKSISNSSTVTVSPSANECPGGIAACGNNNYGNLGACSGAWTYPDNVSWNNWCRQNSNSPNKTFCYQCNQTQPPPPPGGGEGQPSPTPPPVANSQGLFITGKLLIGKILADTFPPRYQIDAGDTLISNLSATVQGVMNVLRQGQVCQQAEQCPDFNSCDRYWCSIYGSCPGGMGRCSNGRLCRLASCSPGDQTQQATIGTNAITGAYTPAGVPNVLRGAPIFAQSDSSCIPDSYTGGANCQAETYAQKQRLEYDTPPNTMVSSNFVKKSYSCTNGCSGNYTKVEPVTPLGLIKTTVFTASGNNNSTSVSYETGNTKSGSCGSGCTLQSKVSYNIQNAPFPPSQLGNMCSGEDPSRCGGSPCSFTSACYRYASLTYGSKTTCGDAYSEIVQHGCSADLCYFQSYATGSYFRPKFYCSEGSEYSPQSPMKIFNPNDYTLTPWSLTINTPVITDIERTLSSLGQWRDLFNWAGVESCYQQRPSNQWTVSPATAASFCSCSCDFPGDTSDASCSQDSGYLTYSCKWPLKKEYSNFNLTPPGKYLLQIPVSAARRINPINGTSQSVNVSDISVNLSISGANLLEVNGTPVSSNSVTTKPSLGVIQALIDAPTASSQIQVSLQSTYNGNMVEEVELGASNLYPLGWYEAEVPFGRTGTTGISDMKVINSGSTYVNTIASENVTDGNRSFSCPKNQDPTVCSIPPGFTQVNSNLLNMINLLMAERPPTQAWIQTTGGDVHSNTRIDTPGGP